MPNLTTPMKHLRWALPALLPLLLSACMGSASPSQPIYYYTLDYPAAQSIQRPDLPVVLGVNRFSASPPFDSPRMIYADKGLHRNAYAHYQWICAPGELLPYLVARDLRAGGGYLGVLTPGTTLEATHTINGWIETFLEDDRTEKWQARICLHITLLSIRGRDPADRILFQHIYRATMFCNANTPAALAEAMSRATAQVSAALDRDVYQCLARTISATQQ
jgi:cholesterol transport system auxiliary component